MVPDSVKMLALELFTGTHNGKTVRTFINACDTYFKLTGISDENIKGLLAKTYLLDTAHTWYESQGCNETMVTFVTVRSHMLDYYIPSDYIMKNRRSLVACKMGWRSVTEYIDDLKKHLVNFRDP